MISNRKWFMYSFVLLSSFIYSCTKEPIISKVELQNDIVYSVNDIIVELTETTKLLIQNTDRLSNNSNFNISPDEILNKSKNALNSLGIDNETIIEEFGSLNNVEIILTSLTAYKIDQLNNQGIDIIDLEIGYNYTTDTYLDLNKINSYKMDDSIVDCALDALGIPAGLIVGSAKNLGRKALLKAARKLATRILGWVGAAVAIYEFGDCMDWW
jgi:hypothetical protein